MWQFYNKYWYWFVHRLKTLIMKSHRNSFIMLTYSILCLILIKIRFSMCLWYKATEIIWVYLRKWKGDELFVRAARIFIRDIILCQNSRHQMIVVRNVAKNIGYWQLLTCVLEMSNYWTTLRLCILASPLR